MTLRVYNTLTRQKENFEPLVPGKVGMYLCGPTVYKPSHIGHMVGPVIFDTIKRYLSYNGFAVNYVINITDVDDKLINQAKAENTTMEELAQRMTADYKENLQTIGVDTVDHFPYATEHIQEMQNIIQKLIDEDHAYPLEGDVYFAVTSDDDYGKLSHRSVDEMMAGTRVEANDRKRHPADFALWKGSREGEPSWESPWGPGRPGWHIECSAMSMKYLGDTIDIHGGGLDLMFPHHENELAQSETCTGKPFSKYWMHNGLMQSDSASKLGGDHNRHGDLAGEQAAQEENKISKTAGAASVRELFEKLPAETIRFFLLSTHYRSPIPYSEERIAETGKSLEGFYRLIETFERLSKQSFYDLTTSNLRTESTEISAGPDDYQAELNHLRTRFQDAMDDDFNTGGAVGVLFDLRKTLNGFITSQNLEQNADEGNTAALTQGMQLFKELSNLLGVFRKPQVAASAGADDEFVNALMKLVIEIRADARQNKNFAVADKIRDCLNELKVTLEDRTGETLWHRG